MSAALPSVPPFHRERRHPIPRHRAGVIAPERSPPSLELRVLMAMRLTSLTHRRRFPRRCQVWAQLAVHASPKLRGAARRPRARWRATDGSGARPEPSLSHRGPVCLVALQGLRAVCRVTSRLKTPSKGHRMNMRMAPKARRGRCLADTLARWRPHFLSPVPKPQSCLRTSQTLTPANPANLRRVATARKPRW